MLKFYLATVIIYMIIINCTIEIFKEAINKKIDKYRKKGVKKANLFKRLSVLFTLAAIPILRTFVVFILMYIATCKQEDYDDLMKKANEF